MTPRTPHRTPSPRSYDSIQKYLLSTAKEFATYLQQAAKSFEHLGKMINAEDSGRLFFINEKLTHVDPALLQTITAIIDNQSLLTHFEKRLLFWQPLFDIESIMTVRLFFSEYYFLPIKQSDEYAAFKKEQLIAIKNSSDHNKNIEDLMEDISDFICSAILFRIISEWKKHNPDKFNEKSALLSKFLNSAIKPADLIQHGKQELSNQIQNAFLAITTLDKHTKIKKEPYQENVANALTNIHDNWYFKGLDEAAHDILANHLTELLKSDMPHKKYFKKAVLRFYDTRINNTHNKTLPLIEEICQHIEPSVIKKYPNLASSTINRSEKISRKLAPIPPIDMDSIPQGTDNTYTPSPLPRTPERIYAKREGMRRRASSATLFTPRNTITNETAPSSSAESTPRKK